MPTGKSAQSGFTLLYVLMLLVLIGMGLAAAGTLWKTDAQRDREADLLFAGDQYRQAIRSYYELDVASPRLPKSIDELLTDNRRLPPVRHLRRAYRDPFTGNAFSLLRTPDTQGIIGVHSASTQAPLKVAGFLPEDEAFAEAGSHSNWKFIFKLPPANANPAALKPPAAESLAN